MNDRIKEINLDLKALSYQKELLMTRVEKINSSISSLVKEKDRLEREVVPVQKVGRRTVIQKQFTLNINLDKELENLSSEETEALIKRLEEKRKRR